MSPDPQVSDEAETSKCLYCNKSITLKPTGKSEYENHLKFFHKIRFNIEDVIKQTEEKDKKARESGKESGSKSKFSRGEPNNVEEVSQIETADSEPIAVEPTEKPILWQKIPVIKLLREPSIENLTMNQNEDRSAKGKEHDVQSQPKNLQEKPKCKVKLGEEIRINLPWYFGCEYRCLDCGLLFFFVEFLRRHIRSAHNNSPDDYLDEHGQKDFETKAVYWRCLACDVITKRHFTSISRHLTSTHDMSLENYMKNYGQQKHWEISTRGPLGDEHKKEKDEKPAKRRKISKGYLAVQEKKSRSEMSDVFISFENFLTFSCNAENCQASYNEAKDLVKHIQTNHGLTEDFAPCFNEISSFNNTKKCEFCNVKIINQESSIIRHLANHKWTAEMYQQRIIDEKRHTKVLTNSYELSDFHSWLNGECVYACFLCCEEICGSSPFWKHVEDSHGQCKTTYTQNNGDSLLEEKSTLCALCLEEILHEEESIYAHLKVVHKLSPLEYFKKHLGKFQKPRMGLAQLRSSVLSECQFCDFTTKWRKNLKYHVFSKHGFSFKTYRTLFGKSLSEITQHECLICNKIVTLFENSMDTHLSSHNCTTSVYHEKFFEQVRDGSIPKQVSYMGPSKNHPSFQTDDKIYKAWLSKFEYDCPECDAKAFSQSDIQSHIKACHFDRSLNRPKSKRRGVLKCKLCNKSFLFILKVIDRHFSVDHDLTIDEYYYNHIRIPFTYNIWRCSPPWMCQICNYTDVALEIVQQHLKVEHKTNDQSKLQPLAFHKCELCHANINHDAISLYEHAATHSLNLRTYYEAKVCLNFPSNINPISLRSVDEDDNQMESENLLEIETPTLRSPSVHDDQPSAAPSSAPEVPEPGPIEGGSSVSTGEPEPAIEEGSSVAPTQFVFYDVPNLESDSLFLPALQPSEKRFENFNKCIFKCRLCNVYYQSFKAVKDHLATKHSMTLGKYLESYAPLNWEVSMYSCPECKMDILQDVYIVETHMVTKHKSSLCCISKPALGPSQSSEKEVPRKPMLSHSTNSVNQLLPIEPINNSTQNTSTVHPKKLQQHSLLKSNQPVSVVPTQSPSSTQPVQVHQQPISIIPMQNSGFKAQQNTSFPNQTTTIYPPFQSSVRPQNFSIGPPLFQPPTRVQNSGSLQIIPIRQQQAYPVNTFQYLTGNQTNYIASNCGPNQAYNFVQQPAATSSNFIMTPTPQLQQVVQIQPTPTVQNGTIILNCEQKQQGTDSNLHFRWNRCILKCDLCEIVSFEYPDIADHINQAHRTGNQEKEKFTIREMEVKHKCLECGSAIKFTKDPITAHLYSHHMMTLQAYEKKHYNSLCQIFDNLNVQTNLVLKQRKLHLDSIKNGNFPKSNPQT